MGLGHWRVAERHCFSMAQTLDEIVEEIGISREEAKHLYDEYKSGKSGFDNKNKKIKKVSKKC